VRADPGARTPESPADRYDGASALSIAGRLGVAAAYVYGSIDSTMDAAHALAEAGAASGTLILADAQTAGRGRQGRPWHSGAGRGIWLTLIERPADASGLEVLSLRVGLATARALAPFADAPVRVKWPNDVFVGEGKVAGVLVEARWRGGRPDWVAIGVGVNVHPPLDVPAASGLPNAASRMEVLLSLIPAIRAASGRRGALDAPELVEYAARDYARGRRCAAPVRGVVVGLTAVGQLLVQTADGVRQFTAGSLVLEEGA
jgi:BirA family biotin operon repressor/biotin-[acetyl-CoA-carboxylase] ligase